MGLYNHFVQRCSVMFYVKSQNGKHTFKRSSALEGTTKVVLL